MLSQLYLPDPNARAGLNPSAPWLTALELEAGYRNARSARPTGFPFPPSTPCTIQFECLKSGPNDSTRVRRLTGIFRRACVEIFIVVYVRFWLQLSEFSSNLTGHHETKLQNGYGAVDQNIQTFMSNLGYL
jgi:hypothetical protein